jgi:crotonobetainyl-CoA:carnitine CoA-transferase CaiB-like acyl-CoA transferase
VSGIFAGMGKQELMDRCEALGLPFAPIAKPEDLFEDPHLNASGGLAPVTLENGLKTRVPVLPIAMNGERFGTRRDVPRVGEHTREVLAAIGYESAEIASLLADGIVA